MQDRGRLTLMVGIEFNREVDGPQTLSNMIVGATTVT